MKKVVLLLFGLLISINAYAVDKHGDYASYDYFIENVDFKMDVKNDYTYYVTESIDVNFVNQTTQLDLFLPDSIVSDFDKISNIKVNEPFEFDKSINILSIGDEKEYYEGLVNFKISYVYHARDINFSKEDFEFSLFKFYNTLLKKGHFVVKMPGKFSKEDVSLYEEENFTYEVKNNSIIIDLKGEVDDSSGFITIYNSSKLFKDHSILRCFSLIISVFLIFILIIFFILIISNLIRIIRYCTLYRKRTIFDLDSNPIFVNYLLQDKLDKKDLVGNLIYLDRIDCISFDLDNFDKDKDFKLNKGLPLSVDYFSNMIYKDLFKEDNSINKNTLSSKLDSLINTINKKIKREISLFESRLISRIIVFVILAVIFVFFFIGTFELIDDVKYGFFDNSSFIILIVFFIMAFVIDFLYERAIYKDAKKKIDFIYDLDNLNINDDSKNKLLCFICCNTKLIFKLEKNKEKTFKDRVKFYDYLINFFDKN